MDAKTQLRPSGCTKQLVQPGTSVLTYTEAISCTPTDGPIDLYMPAVPASPLPRVVSAASGFRVFSHPPAPPDLIIVLQHWLI
jgi:hypothetical protein